MSPVCSYVSVSRTPRCLTVRLASLSRSRSSTGINGNPAPRRPPPGSAAAAERVGRVTKQASEKPSESRGLEDGPFRLAPGRNSRASIQAHNVPPYRLGAFQSDFSGFALAGQGGGGSNRLCRCAECGPSGKSRLVGSSVTACRGAAAVHGMSWRPRFTEGGNLHV